MNQKVVRQQQSAVAKAIKLVDFVQSFALFVGALAVVLTFMYLLFSNI